tara:strand:- start:2600 stop:3895 length:1296 start_codon:yes stop_codon:yes gene_type:complete
MNIKNINQLYGFVQMSYICLSEYTGYCIFGDYSKSIDNAVNRLATVNILYVKLFQALSLTNNLIDQETKNHLLTFTDNAPWTYRDIDFKTLKKVGETFNIKYVDGCDTPLNSGMISLAFKAYTESNKPVLVKIMRNDIKIRLANAIDDLVFGVNILSFIPFVNTFVKKYNLSYIVTNTVDMILDQTDFSKEVQNMITMSSNCSNMSYVIIPKVYPHVTEEFDSVILMDFIDGQTCNEVDEEDYEEFAKQVVKFGFTTLSIHGVTHGDLHAGNVLFVKDANNTETPHKIAVLDFGIIYTCDDSFKELLLDILSDFLILSPKDMSTKILLSGIIQPDNLIPELPFHHYEFIKNSVTNIIEDTINSSNVSIVQLYSFVNEFYNFLNHPDILKIGLRPSVQVVKCQLVLAMTIGLTLKLCKEDYMKVVYQVISEF